MQINLNIHSSEVLQMLADAKHQAEDTTKIFNAIIPIIKQEEARNFGTQTSSQGKPWEPNKKGTTTLWGKGKLFDDTQDDSNYQIKGNVLEQTGKHPGAYTHQLGLLVRIFGRTPPYKFPARPYAGISDKGVEKIKDKVGGLILNVSR